MYRTIKKLLLLSSVVSLLFAASFLHADKEQTQWEVIDEDHGFISKRRKVAESDIYAFRGEVLADVHISKILSVFLDKSRRKDWVDLFGKQEDLEVISGLNKIYWIRFNLPFFMSDRDYVLQLKGNIDVASRQVTANIASVEHLKKPEQSCCIRAQAFGTFYRFRAQNDKTYVEVEVLTDPKGWLPSWLINLIQKNWPKKTLTALIAAAKDPKTKADTRFAGW
jgi:hypothetical protein